RGLSPPHADADHGGRRPELVDDQRRDRLLRPGGPCRVVSRLHGPPMTDPIEIPESFPGPGAVAGKRVVITGASRGLGAVLAHGFSHAGASVALVARTAKDLKAVAEALPGPCLVL